ncbi:MAG: SDR family oxidoreductase [Oscillospiraceae bacterium]|nr:SDR family oxidoreductase [Oscillospiraceae bacterium]
MSEKDKTTLLLGADSDMGAAIASKLKGRIIAHYFAAEEKLASLKGAGREIIPLKGDLSSLEGINAFISEVEALGLEIDRLVHLPSAPAAPRRFRDFDPERFGRDFNISFMSAALACRAFVPKMAKRRFGRVVFMLSSYAFGRPPQFLADYVACKSALAGLMRSLAAEYAARGVTVNGVAPSMTETAFLKDLPDFSVEQNARQNPTGRNASPQDIAPAFELLLSEEAGYINGAVITASGGELML